MFRLSTSPDVGNEYVCSRKSWPNLFALLNMRTCSRGWLTATNQSVGCPDAVATQEQGSNADYRAQMGTASDDINDIWDHDVFTR